MAYKDTPSLELILTDKGKYAIACVLVSHLMQGMEYNDLVELCFDYMVKEYLSDENKLRNDFIVNFEDMSETVTKMTKALSKIKKV